MASRSGWVRDLRLPYRQPPGPFDAPPCIGRTKKNVKPTRVLLVDDHALVRAGIRALLEQSRLVEVVGEAGNYPRALELMEQLSPDIMLLDLEMPGIGGLEVLKATSEKFSNVRIIVLTARESEDYAFRTLRAGAAGYISKIAADGELDLAIARVMTGEKYLSPGIEQKGAFASHATDPRPILADLTPRQREVLTLIAEGRSTKDIARALTISGKTVETHRAQLMDRLDIHDIASLVKYAIKVGLVLLEERGAVRKTRGAGNSKPPIMALFLSFSALLRFFPW